MHNTTTQKVQENKFIIFCAFAVLFIYGALLLMIGYTQGGLSNLFFGESSGTMVYLLVAQSAGLIIAALVVSQLIKKFNIRYIFTLGFSLAAVALILISLLDKMAPRSASLTAGDINTTAVVLFFLFSLLLGTSIGPMSPLVSTFLSAVFQGDAQVKMLSGANGVYGIGAGIIPLVASRPIYDVSTTSNFDQVRYFYYIAFALALLGAVCGYMINYKHSRQLTSAKILETLTMTVPMARPNPKKNSNYSIVMPLILLVVIMSFYMVGETIMNYMFVNISTASRGGKFISTDVKINATMAFGLLVMVQGLWRAASGLWVAKRVSKAVFILASCVVLGVGIIMILTGLLDQTWGQFVIAILIGLGLGNLWPIIYTYSIDIDSRRASFIGMVINIVSMFWIPVTQVIVAPIWSGVGTSDGFAFYTPMLICAVCVIGVVALTVFSIQYFRVFRKKHPLEIEVASNQDE